MAGAAALLILIAVLRIISTYSTFGETWDEPAHLAAGMEWWEFGTYTHEYQHPPLARIALALGPYLDGTRPAVRGNMWVEGRNMLDTTKPDYHRTLALARVGVLPFFILASLVVWFWSFRFFGGVAALISTALFTTLPEALAHGGIAATDMALCATVALTVLTLTRWLEKPSLQGAIWAGGALGLALLSKMSALLFLPLCGLAIMAWRWRVVGRPFLPAVTDKPGLSRQVIAATLVATIVFWAGYRFSFNPIEPADSKVLAGLRPNADAPDSWRNNFWALLHAPIYPLTEFVWGIFETARHNHRGHKTFLLGEAGVHGWWYYFPVVAAVKLPIAFLILSAVGGVSVIRRSWRERVWPLAVPAICAAMVLIAVLPSQINIGARHILPMFLFMAILGGAGAAALLRSPSRMARIVVVPLIAWQVIAGARIHPDYLTYFNEFAGGRPESIVSDSSLDWGQDRHRLGDALKARNVEHVTLLIGSKPLTTYPDSTELEPFTPTTGWVAVGMTAYTRGGEAYKWLEAFEPVEKIGRSIRLYYIAGQDTGRDESSAAPIDPQ